MNFECLVKKVNLLWLLNGVYLCGTLKRRVVEEVLASNKGDRGSRGREIKTD
jgi:hypothetical protein